VKRAFRFALVAAALILAGYAYERFLRAPPPEELQRLRDESRRLEAALAGRTDVALAKVPRAAIVVGVPAVFAERFAGDMAARLAPEIRLALRDLKVAQEADVHGKILFGRSRLGRFTLNLDIDAVQARLRPGRPKVTIAGDRLKVVWPVALREGFGYGHVRFHWDGHGVAGAICGDVDIAGAIGGSVRPADYAFDGAFDLAVRERALVARPVFDDAKVMLQIEPNAETWRIVEDAIHGQGAICRRALAIAGVQEKIRGLVSRGFVVTLPSRLLREVTFPAGMEGLVAEGGPARFDVRPVGLTAADGVLWYGADVRLTKTAAAP
jgi:hypothetical protein